MIRTFKKVLSIEADLWQKIITAVNAKYIAVLSGYNTNSINNTTDVILKNIFNNYGKIILQMLTQREDVLKQMNFDVDALIDTVSNDVK